MEREAQTWGLEGGVGPVGMGQAGGAARRARRRMAATRLARSGAVGARVRASGRRARRQAGAALVVGREARARPIKVKNVIFPFICFSKFIQMKF